MLDSIIFLTGIKKIRWLTHNIANKGFRGMCRVVARSYFVTVDTDATRTPQRFIPPTVVANIKMKETTKTIELVQTKCLDIDAQDTSDFLTITEDKKIISSAFQISIDFDLWFPNIRRLNQDKFLLIDTRTKKDRQNGWIIDNQGQIKRTFMAGDGIEDIVIQENKIIISYFDEGIFSGIEPSDQGLVVFDFDGKILFNYRDKYGHAVDVADCYCLCPKGNKGVLFSMYTDFPLIELNLDTFEQTVHQPPGQLNGAGSITNSGADIFFHAPYQDKRGIYKWTIGNEQAEKIGEYSPHLRGLQGGKYLACGETGYTIVDLNE